MGAIRSIDNEFIQPFDVAAHIQPIAPVEDKEDDLEIRIKGIALKVTDGLNQAIRNGVRLEKSIVLTKERILENQALFERYCELWSVYPDLFLDFIRPVESTFRLAFYQRIFLRAIMRYQVVYCTAPRGFSKSFTTILGIYLLCIFRPGYKTFICAPGKEQGAKIGSEKIHEIWDLWPLLKKEIVGDGSFGKDYVKLTFRNGSILDIVGALETTRGGRRNGGLIDEVRDHDGDILNEVVLPLLVVERRTKGGRINPNEPQACQFYMTSAGVKSSYAYAKLIESLQNMIIQPKSSFVFGCDYRVPVMEGILSKNYLQQMRLSPTYKEDQFARESLGIWTGGSSEAWFDYDRLSKYRVLVNSEKHKKIREADKVFYLLSVDVARLTCQTVVTVFKVHIKEKGYFSSVVNIVVLGRKAETKHFEAQAIELKKMIAAYEPKEVVVDGNGLGVGFLDFLSKPQYTPHGDFPAYGVFNDDDYKKTQPRDCIPLIYLMRANGQLNSKIHGNCFNKVMSGHVFFLIKEQDKKTKIWATKVGQRMKPEERTEILMPYTMTTRLFEEMGNLKLKQGSGLDINLEQISSGILKDKFSSLEYGLWRINELEQEEMKKNRKRGQTGRKLTFYSEGAYGR